MTKVLFLSANPLSTGRLAIDLEIRDIEESIKLSDERSLELVHKPAVRTKDIGRALLREKPTIVHFSGHGSKLGGLAVEGKNGDYVLLKPKRLSKLFGLHKDTIRCVVLNACYSDKQAQELVKHIPYVIGCDNEIEDKIAREFSVAFYDAIGAGRDIKFAFEHGKNSLLETSNLKTNMLILKINELESKLLDERELLKKKEAEIRKSGVEISGEDADLKAMFVSLLSESPFPLITGWLYDNKKVLIKKAQSSCFQDRDALDEEIFRSELGRHFDLIINSLLFGDESGLDEPDLNKSYSIDYYIDALDFILGRVPSQKFPKPEMACLIKNIKYLQSRF